MTGYNQEENIWGIVDGVLHQSNKYGDEWDEEVIAEPIEMIRRGDYSKEIESLLLEENMHSGDVCVDVEMASYDPIYLQLKEIYRLALNVIVNGKEYRKPEPVIELRMLPEEYIAVHYDFFEMYNNDDRIKRKKELREEIIYTSQEIVQALKEIIEKIIKIYEVKVL